MGSDARGAYNAVGRDELLWFDPDTLTIVEDEPDHPLYDPDRVKMPLPTWMVASVLKNGVKEAIQVRLNGKHDSGQLEGKPRVEVVNGRQRVRACRVANKQRAEAGLELLRVPGTRTRGTDVDLLEHVIITNEHRNDDTPMARARKLQRYLNLGRTEEDAAIVFRVSGQTIKNWLALLSCHESVQKAIDVGKVPASIAKELGTLSHAEQKTALNELIANGHTKGEKGKTAAKNARDKGKTESDGSPKRRMRSKEMLTRWRKSLSKVERKDAEIARAVLGYVLGHDRALADYPHLAEVLES